MYNRQIIQLAQQMRRLVLAEFGDRLSLTDPQLVQRLLDYASRSRCSTLPRLAAALEQEWRALAPAAPDPQPPRRMYRGQELVEEPSPESDAAGQSAPGPVGQRVYRGTVIG